MHALRHDPCACSAECGDFGCFPCVGFHIHVCGHMFYMWPQVEDADVTVLETQGPATARATEVLAASVCRGACLALGFHLKLDW